MGVHIHTIAKKKFQNESLKILTKQGLWLAVIQKYWIYIEIATACCHKLENLPDKNQKNNFEQHLESLFSTDC